MRLDDVLFKVCNTEKFFLVIEERRSCGEKFDNSRKIFALLIRFF